MVRCKIYHFYSTIYSYFELKDVPSLKTFTETTCKNNNRKILHILNIINAEITTLNECVRRIGELFIITLPVITGKKIRRKHI